ncbi:hypothetical protein OXPF_07800 [Oxobacter pfennigii]|uniref:GyrI-like small molecule binding domain-containing protein n=1 Tax=Oxobacter pfennigii TaxID=36849 RepID=A0A0P8YEB5_9CLOT|nr:GyrI-like domain-containing protein [Oxobacter pfennigii]KPU45547.1 hypothetical protein OXPF_07800 [Oxobacter pfennigii]
MKHEWKKEEKNIYLPKGKPVIIEVPKFNFFTIEGKGNPNSSKDFSEAIGVLYSLSYGIKMLPKKDVMPSGYFEYTIYPLEGIWDLSEEARGKDILDKDELIYKIMIRQPDFTTDSLALEIIGNTKKKKPHPLLDKVKYESIEDGLCVQMMHLGSYDDEPKSFESMKEFCKENNLVREDLRHREIYLSDFRKTAPDKLKTVLRYSVKKI